MKTQVKIVRSGVLDRIGKVGYIDGYITYNKLHPKCMVVLGKEVIMCDPNNLEAIEEDCVEYSETEGFGV